MTTDESDAQQDQMLNDAAYDGPAVNVADAYERAALTPHDEAIVTRATRALTLGGLL